MHKTGLIKTTVLLPSIKKIYPFIYFKAKIRIYLLTY